MIRAISTPIPRTINYLCNILLTLTFTLFRPFAEVYNYLHRSSSFFTNFSALRLKLISPFLVYSSRRILAYWNSKISVFLALTFGGFSKSLPKNRHSSFLPRHLPLFLAVFGIALEHVDSNIIVRISRGDIRRKLCASLCARESYISSWTSAGT